jgi:hypothetical protein
VRRRFAQLAHAARFEARSRASRGSNHGRVQPEAFVKDQSVGKVSSCLDAIFARAGLNKRKALDCSAGHDWDPQMDRLARLELQNAASI